MKTRILTTALCLIASSPLACSSPENVASSSSAFGESDGERHVLGVRAHDGTVAKKALLEDDGESSNGGASSAPPIDFHGGDIMEAPKLYLIFYGDWTDADRAILTDLASGLGSSSYFHINATYGDGHGHFVNDAFFAGSVNDAYSHGKRLGSTGPIDIVEENIKRGALPVDTDGIYLVLGAKDVSVPDFCSKICGYHSFLIHQTGPRTYTNLKYAFVGDASVQCPGSCDVGAQPNGSPGADAMASVMAHEIVETASDPHLRTWFDRDGNENADKCAWSFGNTYATPNDSRANVKIGSRDYLLQQNWVNAGDHGYCATDLSVPGASNYVGAMHAGDTLGWDNTLTSSDGRFLLVLQRDQNLVLYRVDLPGAWRPMWAAGWHRGADRVVFQGDGNLVAYTPTGAPTWSTDTWQSPGSTLALQDDGNLVVYAPDGTAVWASNAPPPPPDPPSDAP